MATSTTDPFSAEDSDATTSGDTLSTDEEYKYAQLSVPNFSFDTTSSSTSTSGTTTVVTTTTSSSASDNPSGNSFIRLGSFPYSTTTTTTGSSTSTTIDYPDAPTGFEDSLTLAKLVGDATALAAYTATDSTEVDEEESVLRSDPYKGDPKGLLGFADDTRVRDDAENSVLYIDKAAKTNSAANRQTETKRLLTKGGWWDHSDGNRISTTAGDKVEVIQGNYKLVVLGRRAASDTSDKKVVDISGGYEFSKKYVYLASEKVWATYEESSKTYATKKTSGKEVTEFTGTYKETVIGKDPGKTGFEGGNAYDLPDDEQDPTVVSKTWAKTMETYIGSANKPVPNVVMLTFAHGVEDVRMCTAGHLTSRSAGGSVVSTNLAAINITSMNAALSLLNIAATVRNYDLKFGYTFTWHNFTTITATKKTEVNATTQAVNGAKTELTGAKTELVEAATTIAKSQIQLAQSNTNINGSNVTVSTQASTEIAPVHHKL